MSNEICIVCSSDKDLNGLIICTKCNSGNLTIENRLNRVIELLKTPESSDDIWFCVGELEEIVKGLSQKVGA